MRAGALVSVLALAALVLSGCGGGAGTLANPTNRVGQTDINPQPRERVRDGGTLRLPMEHYPSNFNYPEIDGTHLDVFNITEAVLPSLYTATPDGGLKLNPDYLTSAAITSTSPQVVTFTLNPKATWSDGAPMSWQDFASYWKSQNGKTPGYQVSGTFGFDDITSVTRGADDKQAVVTFAHPYAEWENLFNPFLPASLTSSPTAFNTAWQNSIPVTAGPFTIESANPSTQTVTLKRDPKWWGVPAKLDRIVFRRYDFTALADAIANNEIDYFEIGPDINLFRRAQNSPGVTVRDAPSLDYTHITLNGAAGSLLANLPLRQAIAQGIDRQAVTRQMLGPIESQPTPDGNHLYVPGTRNYRDNSGALPHDPAAAARTLEQLGWRRTGPTRQKDGKPLTLRLVYGIDPANDNIAKAIQSQLAQLGVTVTLQPLAQNELFVNNIIPGNFDLALFTWGGTASPFSSSVAIYGLPVGNNAQENYGRVGSPEIDRLFAQGNAELDDTKRAVIGNQLDTDIWKQAHSVVLYARPGAVAVRSNLANFGARGFADPDYIDAGFVK